MDTKGIYWMAVVLLWVRSGLLSPAPAYGQAGFDVESGEFFVRDVEDAGEVRLWIKNTSQDPISMSQIDLRVTWAMEGRPDSAREASCLFVRLMPPSIIPGCGGELVGKLKNSPRDSGELKCKVTGKAGLWGEKEVAVRSLPASISYVGFSEDLSSVFVYVENKGKTPLEARCVRVAGRDASDGQGVLNRAIAPGDKGCLVFEFPEAQVFGQLIDVVVQVKADEQFDIHRTVKVINQVPLLSKRGGEGEELALDSGCPFVQTMNCINHSHGTHEEAAKKFLDDYGQRYARDAHQVILLSVCRSDMPRAWFRFGSLSDVLSFNPVLRPGPRYLDKEEVKAEYKYPFLFLGAMAKKSCEPNRFLAILDMDPLDGGLFKQAKFTAEEVRFLLYAAVASGAKGLFYRGQAPTDPLGKDMLVRLNAELGQLKPLWLIAEPVNWARSTDDGWLALGLCCGDRGILIFVFDRRYFSGYRDSQAYTPAFGRSLASVKVEVRLPRGLSVADVRSLSGSLDRDAWECKEGLLAFTGDMVDSVHVFEAKIKAERGTR